MQHLKNPLLKNLHKIEFPVTYLCTGKCRHCSEADKSGFKGHIRGDAAAKLIADVSAVYDIENVLLFGGEPLLYPDDCFLIMSAAREAGVKKRCVITNGWFSKDVNFNCKTAEKLVESGCNRVLLSVDSFHQETIPLESVMIFANELERLSPGIIKLNPAWIKGKNADNPYDKKTTEIVEKFTSMGISENKGNIIFPAGNALKYLSEYFDPGKEYINPYEEDPMDLRTLSVGPDGSLLGGNIYRENIFDIFSRYKG